MGYVFTFLLGVVLLSMFGVWAYGIETATRERWNATAIQANLDDVAEAVERADDAARLDAIFDTSNGWIGGPQRRMKPR